MNVIVVSGDDGGEREGTYCEHCCCVLLVVVVVVSGDNGGGGRGDFPRMSLSVVMAVVVVEGEAYCEHCHCQW